MTVVATSASQEAQRRAVREQLLADGTAAYPASASMPTSLASLRASFAGLMPGVTTLTEVTVAGRVMFFRSSGKIAFCTLQEGNGTRLQLMLPADLLGEGDVTIGKTRIKEFDRLVDLGDFVRVTGFVGTSLKGELSVRVASWRMESKALRPLPFLHAELSDETRVRQPYLELIQSSEARERAVMRSRILRTVRRAFEDDDFMELETPVLQPIHGGALARPFSTHVNALRQDFTLRIALELPLKKAVVGGLERVFEMGKVFRNEGMDSSHTPEFSMLEAYEAYGSMETMAARTEELFRSVCATVTGSHELELAGGTVIDFAQPWQWLSVYAAVSAATNTTIDSSTSAETLQSLCAEHNVAVKDAMPAGKYVMELCSELVEPTLIQPTFLYDWPAEAQPLARRQDNDEARILAWDLIINGMEVATAFTELVDPVVQREILTEQARLAANGDAEAMAVDESFLTALEYGAPPMGGFGLGLDRFVGLFTQASVRETQLFPLVRRDEA